MDKLYICLIDISTIYFCEGRALGVAARARRAGSMADKLMVVLDGGGLMSWPLNYGFCGQ